MNVLPYTVVFISAELTSRPARENIQFTAELEDLLTEEGFAFERVEGCYKGTKEASFMVVCDNLGNLKELAIIARQFGQESILIQHPDRTVELFLVQQGVKEPLAGRLQPVSPKEALSADSYTFIPRTGLYYILKSL